MAKVRSTTIVLFVICLPPVVGIFLYGPFVVDLFLHRRTPSRFLIPSGYVGWARIEYEVPNLPPLSREGTYRLVPLDKNGTAQTSSDLPDGWPHDQFFYYSGQTRQPLSNAGWCKGGMIWSEVIVKEAKSGTFQKFFVGTEEQFRMETDPSGTIYSPCG